jgi:uncharacterized protein
LNAAPQPEPQPSAKDERLQDGVARFNRGEFFECHEILEAAWLDASGEEKIFLQGLIQLAVSFYHLRRGNFTGSGRLLRAALEKLSGAMGAAHAVELRELVGALPPLLERIESGQASPETPLPRLQLLRTE